MRFSSRRLTSPHRLAVLALGLVIVAAACGGSGSDGSSPDGGSASSSASGSGDAAALTFTAAQLGGGEFAASSLAGKRAVLWFWAPWCTICRAEAPDIVAAAEAFAGEVEVIGIAGRGSVSEMEGFVSDTATGGLTHVVDGDGAIWSAFDVFAQPAFAFVDESGTVEVFVGSLGRDGLEERMAALTET